MHAIKTHLLFLLFLQNVSALAQQSDIPKTNIYEKDTLWSENVTVAVASLVALRTFLFEFNSGDKAAVFSTFDPRTICQIKDLDSLYQEEVLRFKNWFTRKAVEGDRNQQAYSYLDASIQLDKFFFYPDVYAILLNPVRLTVMPKIDVRTRVSATARIMQIAVGLERLAPGAKNTLKTIHADFKRQYPSSPHQLFQGAQSEQEKQTYELINLLMWLSRNRS
ncbi:MAG: hypothetical protein IPH12_14200 [Saprospirales bacterium]|nr:hypothetical protein [Saprospirales bacterium]MBK8924074.1 hypothetical protein [Saprospirales bacterium]